jgi:anti-sigma-K factor RskA
MSQADDNGRELTGDEALAAEYVLGVLDADERRAAERRIADDPGFARLVDAWEVRFAPLGEDYAPQQPPASVKTAIDRRLFAGRDAQMQRIPLLKRLVFWQALSAAALAALLLAVLVPALRAPVPGEPPPRMIASLSADDSDVRYVALYDAAAEAIALSHLSGHREAGRDFELWVIEGDGPPRSLGVIPEGATVHLKPAEELQEEIEGGATLAISLEPAGGSPTGAPTGPVVAHGELRRL